MTSAVDPRKLKDLMKDSQTSIPQADDDEEYQPGGEADEEAGEEETGDEGSDEEATVETVTADLKAAVATINEIIDEFRTGTDAQPKAGVEQLEEEVDADKIHAFCAWTEEAGKKDFRKLGEELDLEDVDGFVGWCRAVRKQQEEGGEEGGEENEGEEQDDGESGGPAEGPQEEEPDKGEAE